MERFLEEIQELNGHTFHVTCLDYMKNLKQLVSASKDNSIIIWNRNDQHKWIIKQELYEHKARIDRSEDKNFQFWQRCSQNWRCQQTISTKFNVSGLSFDDESIQLIACGFRDPEILVMIYQKNKWLVKQTINRQNYGLRLCFIDSNMFFFQPNESEYLELYEIDKYLNKFMKQLIYKLEIVRVVSCLLFPCQFIKLREMLVVKNVAFHNIIRSQENGQFITQQSVNLQTPTSFGRVTNDRLYLTTWDDKVNQIQIRKLDYFQ